MSDIQSILVTGGTGQLGQSLHGLVEGYPEYTFTFPNRQQLDLSDPQSISAFFEKNSFDLIINCAAHTAVDKAESEPVLADQLNHLAVKQLAGLASKNNTKLIHLSTDYVFPGKNYKPYVETDDVDPQGVYGLTKLKGEQAIQTEMPENAVVIRTSWVYSEFGNNFVKTMLLLGNQRDQLSVIFDQVGTPTYADDLAKAIMHIVKSEAFNQLHFESALYHYSNEGVCSWYDFARAIFELNNIDCRVIPIETKDYPTPAIRPHYSVLNKGKIKQTYAMSIPDWNESLKHCLYALQENK